MCMCTYVYLQIKIMSTESPEYVLPFMAEKYCSYLAQVKKLKHTIEQQK